MNNTSHKQLLNPDIWVDNYADYLFNFAIVRVNNSDVAKDLVQETFFAGLKSADKFEGKSTERTWLISILKRKIVDYYRKINSKKSKSVIRMSFYQDGENQGNWIEDRVPQNWKNQIDLSIENEELKTQLDNCIDKLSKKQAIVFRMKTVHEFGTYEICKELDISPSNFWVMIHRARIQLRDCMEKNWFNK